MDTTAIVYATVVLACAYFVRGMAGFGSGLIAIPLLALVFPITVVVPVVVCLDFLASAAQGLKNRTAISWRDLIPLLPSTIAGIFTAVYLFQAWDSQSLGTALGVFVLVFAVYQLLPLPRLRGGLVTSVPLGYLGGLIGTLFGTGGPLYIIYFSLRNLSKEALRATFAAYFVVDGSIRISSYIWFGFIGTEGLLAIACALPIVGAALVLGGRVHFKLSPVMFRRLISVLLVGSGTLLLLNT